MINGKLRQVMLAAREMNDDQLPEQSRNWINQHLVYTHGFGFVSASSNVVNEPDGTPQFTESDIPPHGVLSSSFQPRIYFGETSPGFSIVGAPAKSPQRELDYPNNSGTGQQNFTYDGKGGVAIGSAWRRLMYALKFKDKNFIFSSGVNSESRVLYIRNPRERVSKVAPFLTLDGDPYPAIADGHVVWIVDGYTTSDGFPYAARTSLSNATNDTLAQTQANQRPVGQVNYIRNSVKATVDAYDGTVNLYEWGPSDPVLQTWMKAFPGVVKKQSDIPAALLPHLRYPEDLFKVQRSLLTKYHITDPHSFYAGTDYWKIPDDPTKQGTTPQPPYYLTLARPGQTSPSFQLTTSLLQNNGRNLAAFVSADSDPASPTYGTLFTLQLPSNALVPGPGLVHNDFRAFPAASTEISLLDQHGSTVDEGNLLTLPIGGSFVYVEPLYVRSTAGTSFPTLKRVLVSFNGTVAYAPTFATIDILGTHYSIETRTVNPLAGVTVAIFDTNNNFAPGRYGIGLTTNPINDGAGIIGVFASASPNFVAQALLPTVFTSYYGVSHGSGPCTSGGPPVCPRVDIPWVLHDPSNALWNLTLRNYEEDYPIAHAPGDTVGPLNTAAINAAVPEPST